MFLSPVIKSEFIFERAPFPSCHASTLVETSTHTLLCAWFGGAHEGASDVGIYLSRYSGSQWTTPVEVAVGKDRQGHPVPCWNPVLFQPNGGKLFLFYKAGNSIPYWKGYFKQSDDDGLTWSEAHPLPNGVLGPIKNKPVELSSGRILSGSSQELGGWRVHFEYSDDGAKTWKRTRDVNSPGVIGAIQPSILEGTDGTVSAVGRTQQGKLFYIESHDHGLSWGQMDLVNVDNPNSGIDAVRLASGKYLLCFNNSTSKRTPLNLAISSNGRDWRNVATLEDTPGEFSYPAIIQSRDGLVHISYTWNRVKIKHLIIDPARLGS